MTNTNTTFKYWPAKWPTEHTNREGGGGVEVGFLYLDASGSL